MGDKLVQLFKGNIGAVVLWLIVTLCSCNMDNDDLSQARVLDETRTEVDSLYVRICSTDGKAVIPIANQFFNQLYQLEVTDTHIVSKTLQKIPHQDKRAQDKSDD